MSKHPQGSTRGLLYKGAIGFGSTGIFALNYSEGTAVLTSDSTGIVSFAGGVQPSGQANAKLTGNSTGVVAAASIFPSGGSLGITADSTAVTIADGILIGAHYLTANSTGLLIGAGQITTS